MNSNTVDAAMMAKMFLAGARNLELKKEWINELNVFPVPDGDTGTNMTLTIQSAAEEVKNLETLTLESVSKAISSGSLRGARGNSGVILSQLFRGCSKVWRNETAINAENTVRAFQKAVETAYKAVMKPKEGTILTVAKAGSDRARELVENNQDIELEDLFKGVIDYMQVVLDQTPDMLPVLKEAGVVDSGGQGLVQIMKGCYNVFLGIEEEEEEEAAEPVKQYAYRTEFILKNKEHISKDERLGFVAFLEEQGADVAAERCEEGLKVHINSDDPGVVLSKALEFGYLSRIHVINNAERPQYPLHIFEEEELQEAMADPRKDTEEEEDQEPMPHKDVGFIAVSIGDGLGNIFRELGADYIIEGGQTMNPSTQDIMDAVDKVNADTVFILPNNKNIILAAEQAQNLIHDKKIIVVPSKTIPQGISALVNYLPDKSAQENESLMRDEIHLVKTVELTYAVRDTKIDDQTIHAGDIMGVADNGIVAVGQEIGDTAFDSVKILIEEDSELISVYYGKDTKAEDAEALGDRLREEFPDCEVEVASGGQPLYYYIISIE
ncbi:MAG: DAK2 domain-containing protein [Lachnospiraceae bacterium]|nr:DAK2 domain-containing protein [Lachnospiraceae bacterium]